MYCREINKRYTEIVTEWIGKGYTVNTSTMGGSQGERAHIDLTDGTEIIRILAVSFNDWRECLEGVEIVVGKCGDNVKPHDGTGYNTIWNDNLEIISRERFYKIGSKRNGEEFYTSDKAHAEKVASIRQERYARKAADYTFHTEYLTSPKALEIGKKVVREKMRVRCVNGPDVVVCKVTGKDKITYSVQYRSKSYRLH